MRTAALTALLLCAVTTAGRAQDAASYRALLARAQAGDSTVDFTALRRAWAASPEYAPYGSGADEHRDSLRAAMGRSDWARAIREADAALAVTWLDADTHMMKAYAARQLGDSATAERERAVAVRHVSSVLDSGKGTRQSPFVVVTVAEEYAFLGMAGLRRERQAMADCGNRSCDALEVANEAGEKRTIYFDITLPITHLERTLGGGAKP
jgi:hypothetical protein